MDPSVRSEIPGKDTMRKVLLHLEHLESRQFDTLAKLESLRVVVLRIMKIGIILEILVFLLVAILLSLLFFDLKNKSFSSKSLTLNGEQSRVRIKKISKNTESSKYSTHILQIVRPVGVHSVRFPGVPSSRPIALFLFRSFGTCHWIPSSDGFLATVTPGRKYFCGGVEFEFRYPKWSFDSGIFHFDFRMRDPSRWGFTGNWYTGALHIVVTTTCCTVCTLVSSLILADVDPRIQSSEGPRKDRQQWLVFRNLMTPAERNLPGILVTLKPTEDGPFGKVRNTRKGYNA